MPLCIETKLTLSGEAKTYRCELLHYESGFGILRYIIEREYDIQGLKLAPGDETIALYWEGRPYTLYVWRGKAAQDTAYYFNIADRIVLTPQEFLWRDLAVDILVDQAGVHVLDEHELPADLDDELGRSIQKTKEHLVENHRAIIAEADAVVLRFAPPET